MSGAQTASLTAGQNVISIGVTASDGSATSTYKITVTRLNSPGEATHVYIDGGVASDSASYNSQVPVYWVDGTMHLLTLSDGYSTGGIGTIAQDFLGNIYVVGNQNGSLMGYWKNGSFVTLPTGSYSNVWADSIAIDTNGNVWVLGSEGSSPQVPVYWENSNGPILVPGNPSNISCIQADYLGNVYITGTIGSGIEIQKPYIWKNAGTPTALPLSGGNTAGWPNNIVSDASGNLYVGGSQWTSASALVSIWKTSNGVWQSAEALSMAGYASDKYWGSMSIAVSPSGTVYTAGEFGSSSNGYTDLLYWLSPSATPLKATLPSPTTLFMLQEYATSLDSTNNFFIVGDAGTIESGGRGSWPITTDGTPVYWENGTPTKLSLGSYGWGWAHSVVVGP